MNKKIVIITMAFIILLFPIQANYLQADALVISKAGTLTAKKVMKEVIEDATKTKGAELALMEAIEIASNYQTKTGFKIVCPDGTQVCDKPLQVKTDITDADRVKLNTSIDSELDKFISPNGKGFSKWQKFLDWFAPVFLTTVAMTALTYAIDGDFREMINEVGYNAMVSAGLIIPITTNEVIPLSESYIDSTGAISASVPYKPGVSNQRIELTNLTLPTENVEIQVEFTEPDGQIKAVQYMTSVGDMWGYNTSNHLFQMTSYTFGNHNPENTLTAYRNGEFVGVWNAYNSAGSNTFQLNTYQGVNTNINLDVMKTNAVITRLPYKIGDFYYTDVLMFTTTGTRIEYQIKTKEYLTPNNYERIGVQSYSNNYNATGMELKIIPDKIPFKRILTPPYEELPGQMDILEGSQYKDGEYIALIPPTAYSYQEETTGETVYRVPNATGDGTTYQKEDGTPVDEGNVVPNPTEDPKITPSPDGTPQVTPNPTPSNPAPEPIPLTPTQPAPEPTPTEPPPTGTEEPPLEPFPDGAKCDAKLQFPIFSPLKEQLSTSFPFSIPWDIERAAQAAFGGISSEKPSFKMSIPIYKGENFDLNITTPKFMDDWKPFTDSLLLITFDILIMFGLYRFVKGAGS